MVRGGPLVSSSTEHASDERPLRVATPYAVGVGFEFLTDEELAMQHAQAAATGTASGGAVVGSSEKKQSTDAPTRNGSTPSRTLATAMGATVTGAHTGPSAGPVAAAAAAPETTTMSSRDATATSAAPTPIPATEDEEEITLGGFGDEATATVAASANGATSANTTAPLITPLAAPTSCPATGGVASSNASTVATPVSLAPLWVQPLRVRDAIEAAVFEHMRPEAPLFATPTDAALSGLADADAATAAACAESAFRPFLLTDLSGDARPTFDALAAAAEFEDVASTGAQPRHHATPERGHHGHGRRRWTRDDRESVVVSLQEQRRYRLTRMTTTRSGFRSVALQLELPLTSHLASALREVVVSH
jgi:hypothetical protein